LRRNEKFLGKQKENFHTKMYLIVLMNGRQHIAQLREEFGTEKMLLCKQIEKLQQQVNGS